MTRGLGWFAPRSVSADVWGEGGAAPALERKMVFFRHVCGRGPEVVDTCSGGARPWCPPGPAPPSVCTKAHTCKSNNVGHWIILAPLDGLSWGLVPLLGGIPWALGIRHWASSSGPPQGGPEDETGLGMGGTEPGICPDMVLVLWRSCVLVPHTTEAAHPPQHPGPSCHLCPRSGPQKAWWDFNPPPALRSWIILSFHFTSVTSKVLREI